MPEKKVKKPPVCDTCNVPLPERICRSEEGKAGPGCPTLTQKEVLARANKTYKAEEIRHFAHTASVQEAACYANREQTPYVMQPVKTRIMETCEFAVKMGYKRIGLAFCLGLANEARTVGEILSGYGFEVVSVCCKAGNTPKEFIGIEEKDKINKGTAEAMCNPVFQARLLSAEGADFNILLGLCVGHDTLFFQHTDLPTTVLAVKDRVTGHNPLAAVYQADGYYRKLKHPDIGSGE